MNVIRLPKVCCNSTAISVTGPHTLEMHSCGVENNSATGLFPSTWLKDTECMLSGGMRVVASATLPCVVASVSVAIAGGRCPMSGMGEDGATAISPGEPIKPCAVRVSASTVHV